MHERKGYKRKDGTPVKPTTVKNPDKSSPVTQAEKDALSRQIKENNQRKKAADMCDHIVGLLQTQESVSGEFTSPDRLRQLADNIDFIVDRFGEDLAELTNRADPPSQTTRQFMSDYLRNKAKITEKYLDADADPFVGL